MGSINNDNQFKTTLIFFVNGKKIVEEHPNPEWTLLYYLRHKLRLVGSKEGCGEGGCGACTVMLSKVDPNTNTIQNMGINACLTPLCSLHGCAIITVEGIGSVRHGLHPVQERIAKSHGTQCGFCTPGFVMSMYSLLRNNPKPSENEMEEAFQGNLCRCTGYRPIIDGFKTFCCKSLENDSSPCVGKAKGGCCMVNGNGSSSNREEIKDVLFDEGEFAPYDPDMDIIFPPELQLESAALSKQSLEFCSGDIVTWYRPSSLKELVELKKKHKEAKIVAGNTELGVDMKFSKIYHPVLIYVGDMAELSQIVVTQNDHVSIGAAANLSQLEKFCSLQIKLDGRNAGSVFIAIKEMLNLFGGQQVRNVATAGGNLMTASPIADLNPIWMAVGAEAVVLNDEGKTRRIPISQNFFPSYRKNEVHYNEILQGIEFQIPKENEYVWICKQSRRREDDISIVNCCMNIQVDPESLVVTKARLVFGGMAATTKLAESATAFLIGREWNKAIVQEVASLLQKDFPLEPSAPGGMIAYRQSLVSSMFFKFYLTVSSWLVRNKEDNPFFEPSDLSAIQECTKGGTKSAQLFQIVPNNQKVHDLIGRPIVHLSGLKHATGEAEYTDDIPPVQGELYGVLVLSEVARGTILEVDPKEAMGLKGVVKFFDAKSLPKDCNNVQGKRCKNVQGVLVPDEEIFASKEITCQGQVVGLIVATDPLIAEKGAKLVKIIVQEKPAIVTMEEAIAANSFHTSRKLSCGDVEAAFSSCDHFIEGEMRLGGQEHFYMETQTCLVTPKEEDELHVQVSGQSMAYMQDQLARALSLKKHKVKVSCRRMGGGFGGKEVRNVLVTLATAVAAMDLRVPVRTVMNRQDDMMATGGRHPFLCTYKVGFNADGRIVGVAAKLYSGAGNSLDVSPFVMERAVMTLDSGYSIPNWRIEGWVCKTDLASNTAFRGFGTPQAALFCENIIDAVAESLDKSPLEIRQMHLKEEGDITPCGWKLENVTLKRCWAECLQNSSYFSRLAQIEERNAKNRWKKRGLAIMPIKHDLGFQATFMNQGGALVLIYTDGSVSLNFGGVEMGQGLVTKMIQVATRALKDVEAEKIYFSECSSDKVPNATSTCASMTSDLNGMAIIDACEKLLKRLEPFKKSNPNGKWEDWVSAAYFNSVSLSATGFYKIDHLHYDFENPDSNVGKEPSNYAAWGAACSEVEVDVLTGSHSLLRTDIVMDVGESLNPAVDIGQIEGAFVQGYGYVAMEELLYSPKGHLLTKGPGAYKIPAVGDVPREFYVSLLRGSSNPKAVYSSKGIGEPPLLLSISVYLAIKEAIKGTRRESGLGTLFRLDAPATVERVRVACSNTQEEEGERSKTGTPWAVRP